MQESIDELEAVSNQDVRLLQDAFTDPDFEWLTNNPSFQRLARLKKA